MKSHFLLGSLFLGLTLSALAADPYTDIAGFTGHTDQYGPGNGTAAYAPIQGKDGLFYGTAMEGGAVDKGVVYKATISGTITVLHSFGDGSVDKDGTKPYASLVQGKDGNFYGTTSQGGLVDGQTPNGAGTIFKITPAGVYTVLHRFDYTVEGCEPHAPLILATDGNFYGTTLIGGTGFLGSGGTVFKMTPSGTVSLVTNFSSIGVYAPRSLESPVVEGKDGLLYGTSSSGGTLPYLSGTVFSVTKSGTVKILHQFGDAAVTNDGSAPVGGLIQNSDGAFYGVTPASTFNSNPYLGGGVAFKITSDGTYSIIATFKDILSAGDGPFGPKAGLVKAADGYFYGTTYNGGTYGIGTLYRLTSTGTVTVLHEFGGYGSGAFPDNARLLQAADGNLYGTTDDSGPSSYGSIYQYKLPAVPTAAPVLSSATKATATAGKAFSYQIKASNTPDSYAATGLPKGVTLATATGLISGTPTVTGKFAIALSAVNAKGTGKLTLTLTVAQSTQTITFTAIPEQTAGARLALKATASSGLPITYTVSGPATLAGKVLTFTGGGAVTVKASQPGNPIYKAAPSVSESIVVQKKAQTITFPEIPTKILGVKPFKLTAKTSSGLAITYVVLAGPATLSGATVTVTGAGAIRIEAKQPGNALYAAATAITQRFVVTAK